MAFWTLYRREVGSYFISAVAYVVFFATTLGMAAFFNLIFNLMNDNHIQKITVLYGIVNGPFYWIPLLIQIPIITMRVFSEEFKLGTIEMLLTAPVYEWEVVLAKYFGALTFFIVLWLPLVFNLVCLSAFSNPHVPLLWKTTSNTFLFIFIAGAFYVAIGVLTSVLTKNQIIAAVLSFVLIFMAFALSFVSFLNVTASTQNVLAYFSPLEQMETFSRGIFDSRAIVFYLSSTVFLLFLTQRLLVSRRLKS